MENAYKEGKPSCEVLIAGRVYVIDFEKMQQHQKMSVMFAREIKRAPVSFPKKGVSGIRLPVRLPAPVNDDIDTRLALLNLFGLQDE